MPTGMGSFGVVGRGVIGSTLRQLHECEFMDGAQNVVLIGGLETRKTYAATALGVQAVEHHRRKVCVFSTIERVNVLEQEKAKASRAACLELCSKVGDGLIRRLFEVA